MLLTLKQAQDRVLSNFLTQLANEDVVSLSILAGHRILAKINQQDLQNFVDTQFNSGNVVIGAAAHQISAPVCVSEQFRSHSGKMYTEEEFLLADVSMFTAMTLKAFIAAACKYDPESVSRQAKIMNESGLNGDLEFYIVPVDHPVILL